MGVCLSLVLEKVFLISNRCFATKKNYCIWKKTYFQSTEHANVSTFWDQI